MIYYCNDTSCPRCRTVSTTRIDVETRMPVIVHICTCKGREKHDGLCLRCSGLKLSPTIDE